MSLLLPDTVSAERGPCSAPIPTERARGLRRFPLPVGGQCRQAELLPPSMSFVPSNGRNGMLIIAGHLIVDPADRDRYVADCATAVKQARRAPGCLDFALTADPLDPARVNVYERWKSDAELANFRGSGPDAATQARIVGAEVHKYRISAIEAP